MFWDRLDVWSLMLHRAPQASPGKAGGTKPSHASRAQVPLTGSSPTYVFSIFFWTITKLLASNYNSKKLVRWRVRSKVICGTNYNSPSRKMPFPPIWEAPFQPRCRALWRGRLVLRTWEGGTWDCDGLAFIAQSQTGPWESQWEHLVREWWQGYNSQVWIKLGMEKRRQYNVCN